MWPAQIARAAMQLVQITPGARTALHRQRPRRRASPAIDVSVDARHLGKPVRILKDLRGRDFLTHGMPPHVCRNGSHPDDGRGSLSVARAMRPSTRESVGSRPTDCPRSVGRGPSIASCEFPSKNWKQKRFPLCFQPIAATARDRNKRWHAACSIGDRANAQTSIQPTYFHLLN